MAKREYDQVVKAYERRIEINPANTGLKRATYQTQ